MLHRLVAPLLLAGLSVSTLAQAERFQLSSPDMSPNQPLAAEFVFNGFGCQGGNQSPALRWNTPPAGTRSLAITVYDPDAPTGSGWWHWQVVNLPASTRELPRNASVSGLPAGAVQTRTDFGQPGYGGACPPPGHGRHRYQFTVWALSSEQLPLNAEASGAMTGYMLRQHALGQASLTVKYAR